MTLVIVKICILSIIISVFYFADENEVIMASKRFVIMDSNGKLIFSTSPTETSMSSKKMKVSEIGGIQFSSSIETQNIRSGPKIYI